MSRLKELRQSKADMVKEAQALNAKDDLTEDEQARLEELMPDEGDGAIAKLTAKIKREEALADEYRSIPADPSANVDPKAEGPGTVPAEPRANAGFKSFGEQLQAIAQAGMNKGASHDNRLKWEAAAGANEAVPSEGGFLVQQDYSTELLDKMHEIGELAGRVRRIPISVGNGVKLPVVDETSRANGSRFGGVQAYWANEADTVAASKPKFREMDLRLNKLFGLGYSTEELLADAPALESIMSRAFVEELTFKTEDAIINGTGSGQPLGILNSGGLVTVAAESPQSAATIQTENILNMWARTPIRSRRNLVWVINQDIEPQLYSLTLGSGTAVIRLYTPPGAEGNNSQYGKLLGRDVIPIEYAATLGTVGDIILFDPDSYVMIDKNGVQSASSMHVRFIYDEMAFRFTYRVDGQPVWNTAVTPFKGANTLSPYVALATR